MTPSQGPTYHSSVSAVIQGDQFKLGAMTENNSFLGLKSRCRKKKDSKSGKGLEGEVRHLAGGRGVVGHWLGVVIIGLGCGGIMTLTESAGVVGHLPG